MKLSFLTWIEDDLSIGVLESSCTSVMSSVKVGHDPDLLRPLPVDFSPSVSAFVILINLNKYQQYSYSLLI